LFSFPGILNNLDYNLLECQGLVLAPTRELAQQIEKVMRALGDYLQVRSERFGA
jgi:translation initiation factor 4A